MIYRTFFGGFLFACALARAASGPASGLQDATILIIRHAEKPDVGAGLSPAGQQRAEAYTNYLRNFSLESGRLPPDVVFAAKDSEASQRPRLTVEPFARAAGLTIETHYRSNQPAKLVAALRAIPLQGKCILVSWRHGDIPDLLRTLGAEPENLLPQGKWPDRRFDWVIVLRYDHAGNLIPGSARRINEHLMPGDA